MSVTVKQETVTVAKARKWLGSANEGNRKPRKNVVAGYARDMASGRWAFTADPIRFNGDSKLVDGQHRLMAIIESQTPIKALVVRGLDSESKFCIDTGAKRSLADNLHYLGYTHTTMLASAIRWNINYIRGNLSAFSSGGNETITTSEGLAFIKKNPRLQDYVKFMGNQKFPYGSARMALIGIMYHNRNCKSGEARAFVEQLISGDGITSGTPIHKLRGWLEWAYLREGRLRTTREIQAIVIKSWNAHISGEAPRRLTFRPGGANPEEFPTILIGG